VTLAIVLFAVGLVIFSIGRCHFLFREVSSSGNFPTTLSFWLRFGSVIVAGLFWWCAIVVFIVSRH
jgi:hypothetical protein